MICICREQRKKHMQTLSESSKIRNNTGIRYSNQMIITHVLENDYLNNDQCKTRKDKWQVLDENDERSEASSQISFREKDLSQYLTAIALQLILKEEVTVETPSELMFEEVKNISNQTFQISYSVYEHDYTMCAKLFIDHQDLSEFKKILNQYKQAFLGNDHNNLKMVMLRDYKMIYFIVKTTYPKDFENINNNGDQQLID